MNYIKRYISIVWEKGIIHIFMGTFLVKLVAFLGSIFLVRVLNKQEYGILGYLENIYSYVFVVAGMGVSNAILRYVVLGRTLQEKYNFYYYACKKGAIWNSFMVLLVVLISGFYPHPKAYQEYVWLLNILILAVPFQYTTENVLCNERAMFANQRYALFSLVLSSSIVVTKIISGKTVGLVGVVFSQTFLYVALALIFSKLTKVQYYEGILPEKIKKDIRKDINIYSLQYMITNGLWVIFMLNDTFLLGRLTIGPEVIADYKVAYAIPGSVSLISTAIGIFVTPYFVKNERNQTWIKKNFILTYIITLLFVGALCLCIALAAEPIIIVLFGRQYLNTIKTMRFLLLASFFNCGMRYTTANILAAMGQVKYNMAVSVFGVILQLVINIKMIPVYGTIGVAVTSCIIYVFMAISLLGVFIKHYYLEHD